MVKFKKKHPSPLIELNSLSNNDEEVGEEEAKKKAGELYLVVLDEIQKRLGSNTTDAKELANFGDSLFRTKFLGVFAYDDPTPTLGPDTSLIMNLDCRDQKGSHWVALYWKEANKPALLYDSFGRATVLKNHQLKTVTSEEDAEQGVRENNCGQRCLAFLFIAHHYGWEVAKYI